MAVTYENKNLIIKKIGSLSEENSGRLPFYLYYNAVDIRLK